MFEIDKEYVFYWRAPNGDTRSERVIVIEREGTLVTVNSHMDPKPKVVNVGHAEFYEATPV